MLSKPDAERVFKLVHEDAQSWRAQARQLRLSAEVIYSEWRKFIDLFPSEPGVQERQVAYLKTFLLLMGFAFENLLKGILYGRDPNRDLKKKYSGGHGIVKMASEVGPIRADELDMLERLERYVVWAGRYQLPVTSDRFHETQGKFAFTTNDPQTIEQLFARLEGTLETEWRARGNY